MFSFLNITAYHEQLLNGTTTCREAVAHYLQRVNEKKQLNAFVAIYEKEALEKACALDEKRKAGLALKKLHGVVIAIKDVICYKDHKVTAASAILKDFTSLYTASALQFLLDEDAIILGSCNCDEFAMGSSNEYSIYGKVLNALDENKVPGGSSGGSAVAVQAGLCMVSLGSDTGGSVRQPADFCGVLGLKPGYGRISRYGLIAYASSFDQVGIFANSVADAALLLEVMGKPDGYDSTMDDSYPFIWNQQKMPAKEKTYRFCLFEQAFSHPSLDPEISAQLNKLSDKLIQDGHQVDRIDFNLLDYIVPAYYVLTTAEASSNLSRYDGIRFGQQSQATSKDPDSFYRNNRSEGFGTEVKRRIMLGTFVLSTGYYDAYFSKAQKIRRLLKDQVNDIFNQYDAILMPTSPGTAPAIGASSNDPIATYLADIFTVFANLTGIPAISLPLFSHSNNMPFGLQVMTSQSDEVTLLYISEMLMQRFKVAKASI